jgi:hypothetical protein
MRARPAQAAIFHLKQKPAERKTLDRTRLSMLYELMKARHTRCLKRCPFLFELLNHPIISIEHDAL